METALIIALVILVVVLSALLLLRHIRERNERAALAELAPEHLCRLIETSLRKGGLRDATSYISKVLEEACKCRHLVFLRRSGDSLEFEHGHGLPDDRTTWRLGCSADLENMLERSHLPTPVGEIGHLLPGRLTDALQASGCDLYLSVFWGSRLYGIYFLSDNQRVRLPAFRLAIGSVGQTLSAAYHLAWYRSQHGRLQQRVTELLHHDLYEGIEPMPNSHGLLKLIRHRDSETLVGRIVDEVGRDIELNRYTFFFAPANDSDAIQVHEQGVPTPVKAPDRAQFNHLLNRIRPDQVLEVAGLSPSGGPGGSFYANLQQAGLKYLAAFPLSSDRVGLLAWDDDKAAGEILTRLRQHRRPVAELMANAESFEEVLGLSYTDGLTGLANHRFFVRRLDEEIDRAKRYGRSVALIVFDLDELKTVNDNHGHQAGDSVLRQMGELLRASVRSNDVVARYGGDEFCIIMPESDRATCARLMRRFQHKIAGTRFRLGQADAEVNCTISQGGAVFPDHAENSEQLIYAADMALLQAKNSGRNGFQLC